VVGWDRPEVLQAAASRSAIELGVGELAQALKGADLVYIALPIGVTLDLLPQVARHAAPEALVTDACSVKANVERAARVHFHGVARFLGGHPLAGRERGGIEHADADLLRGARYALIGASNDSDPRVRGFMQLLAALGAEPLWMDAETHDRAVALISHVPQLAAVALAGVLRDATDESGLPLTLAGPGARDSLRLAGSPYTLWRDICLANRENIAVALDRLALALDHLRTHLASRELEHDFDAANEVYKILHQMK
jgi:prephenate dehydrogenase